MTSPWDHHELELPVTKNLHLPQARGGAAGGRNAAPGLARAGGASGGGGASSCRCGQPGVGPKTWWNLTLSHLIWWFLNIFCGQLAGRWRNEIETQRLKSLVDLFLDSQFFMRKSEFGFFRFSQFAWVYHQGVGTGRDWNPWRRWSRPSNRLGVHFNIPCLYYII